MHTGEALAAANGHRRTAFRPRLDYRAHLAQRLGYAIHRPLGKGNVAGQGAVERLGRQQTAEQTHGSTGVTQVDRPRRRLEAVQANAMDGDAAVLRPLDHHSHVAERLDGCQCVLALEEALHFGGAFGQGAEHDRAMGDRLVARYPDGSGQAAARLGQINQVVVVHGVHIGPTGQDFAEMLTGYPGARENAQQLVPVPSVDGLAQRVEVVTKNIQCTQHRLAIGEKDVVPHHRVAAGDPCEITETAGGIAEDLQVLAALGQGVDQGEGQQVRQVAGGRQNLVVMLDLHVLDVRAQRAPQAVDQRQRVGIGLRGGRENHLVPAEQGRLRRGHSALLGTRDRMPRYQVPRHPAERGTRGTHDIALGAANVGQYSLAQVELRQVGQHPLHRQDRHRQLDHVGADAGATKILLATVNHAELHRQAARLGIPIHADHFAEQPFAPQPLGEGAADQAQPHHHQAAQLRGRLLQRRDLSHAPAPCPAPGGNDRSLPAARWRRAGRSASRSQPPDARSHLRAAAPGRPDRHREPDPRR